MSNKYFWIPALQTVSQLFFSVIPAKAGIQKVNKINVSGLSGQAGQ
jgi:hypothetical protein